MHAEAATGNWYKIMLPDGYTGYIQSNAAMPLVKAVKKVTLKSVQPLFDSPIPNSARKSVLRVGQVVNIFATYKEFYFIEHENTDGWILRTALL